jgi:hypothetical protein
VSKGVVEFGVVGIVDVFVGVGGKTTRLSVEEEWLREGVDGEKDLTREGW